MLALPPASVALMVPTYCADAELAALPLWPASGSGAGAASRAGVLTLTAIPDRSMLAKELAVACRLRERIKVSVN